MKNNALVTIGIAALVVVIVVAALANRIFYVIPAGHAAVVFRTFGGGIDQENVLGPGLQTVAPWNRVIQYDVREQLLKEEVHALSQKGLSIDLEVTTRIRPIRKNIGTLHEKVGRDYKNTIVVDVVRAAVRDIVSRYVAEEIYSTKRDTIQVQLESMIREQLAERYIDVSSFEVRDIQLPKRIIASIEDKLDQEQKALKYEYKLQLEQQEAERKRIEAQGIKEFQRIVGEGITRDYLKWKGIEATIELSKSENSKVVIIGGGEDGLPMILGGQ